MDRYEFIRILRAALAAELPAQTVEEHVHYYENYISEEMAGGKSEEEVLEMLGNPRLIARTILDTSEAAGRKEREVPPDHDPDREQGVFWGPVNLRTWYGKVLIFLGIALILGVILAVVGGLLTVILPVLLPLLLVLLVIRIWNGRQ